MRALPRSVVILMVMTAVVAACTMMSRTMPGEAPDEGAKEVENVPPEGAEQTEMALENETTVELDRIEQHLEAPLFGRLQRNGHLIVANLNMTVEHRADIFMRVAKVGEEYYRIGETVTGKGMMINDQSPHGFDVCIYKVDFYFTGEFRRPECKLTLKVEELIKEGECTHWDPNKKTTYLYEPWTADPDVGFVEPIEVATFQFDNVVGTAITESEDEAFQWVDQMQIQPIRSMPCWEITPFPDKPVWTPEPWPTPTWQPSQ